MVNKTRLLWNVVCSGLFFSPSKSRKRKLKRGEENEKQKKSGGHLTGTLKRLKLDKMIAASSVATSEQSNLGRKCTLSTLLGHSSHKWERKDWFSIPFDFPLFSEFFTREWVIMKGPRFLSISFGARIFGLLDTNFITIFKGFFKILRIIMHMINEEVATLKGFRYLGDSVPVSTDPYLGNLGNSDWFFRDYSSKREKKTANGLHGFLWGLSLVLSERSKRNEGFPLQTKLHLGVQIRK